MTWPWVGLITGIALAFASYHVLPEGGTFRGFLIPPWGEVILIIVGICMAFMSLRAILRGEGKRKKPNYTEEEIAKSKAALEQMHLQEHGTLPEYPDAEEKGRENGEKLKQ